MTDSRLRIIVTGLIAQYPLGGVTWDYVQYAAGLARLGHDVYYVEDTGQWPYNPHEDGVSKSCGFNVAYLDEVMSRFGLRDRWAYRFPWGPQWFGLSGSRRAEVVATADLLINVSGTLQRPEEYRSARRMAYIDSDPVFTQVKLGRGQQDFRNLIDLHDVHFTFGESLSEEVPETGYDWRPTRQPVLLSEWEPASDHRGVFTTVMNWTSYKPVTFRGKTYGQKDVEFMRFVDLPSLVAPAMMEVAANAGKTKRTPRDLLAHRGWRVVDPMKVCPDVDSYREYLRTSTAEWSVAKNGYVVGQPGWFSCRSACYLAAGRPAVLQETGFSRVLPTGQGVLPFATVDGAAAAIADVQGDYARHCQAARAIAERWFDSATVLGRLLEQAMSPSAAGAREAVR
ncbi:MAG TPA: glycosyltransferase family 1 protein [Dehalococcoidia bacterium]|nr:glycosyltransferase family 1 protein [Dehalococcoidia bacterium]